MNRSHIRNIGRIKVADLNSLITCVLCNGYYIDATTISECLHSFCRTCIVSYLHSNKYCPICDVQVHKAKPLSSIRADQTLQDIVYKLVPGLFKNEMQRRRDFYSNGELVAKYGLPMSSEKRGDVSGCERLIFTPEDVISVSLEYCPPSLSFPIMFPSENEAILNNELFEEELPKNGVHRRYLQCPGAFSVYHLKKFICYKYELPQSHKIDVMYMHDHLRDEYTLTDLAYIYSWRRNGPMRLFYKIKTSSKSINASTSVDEPPVPLSIPSKVQPDSQIFVVSPGVTIAAAPASQSHLQHPPSPPPSPQMANEPEDIKMSHQMSASIPNRPDIPMSTACSRTTDFPQHCSLPNYPKLAQSFEKSNFGPQVNGLDRRKVNGINFYNHSNGTFPPKVSAVNGIDMEFSSNGVESTNYMRREKHTPFFHRSKHKSSLVQNSVNGKIKDSCGRGYSRKHSL